MLPHQDTRLLFPALSSTSDHIYIYNDLPSCHVKRHDIRYVFIYTVYIYIANVLFFNHFQCSYCVFQYRQVFIINTRPTQQHTADTGVIKLREE